MCVCVCACLFVCMYLYVCIHTLTDTTFPFAFAGEFLEVLIFEIYLVLDKICILTHDEK